jgi:hypothetical protein
MKKLALVPIAALALAACADMPTAPLSPLGADGTTAALSSHVWQAGNGNAFHGYSAPTLDALVDGNEVELCAGWTDGSFDVESTKFYSFDFFVWDEEEEDWMELPNGALGDEFGQNACLQLEDLDDGTYLFGANAMARVGEGPTTTHHTETAELEVTVGGTWTIEIVGGSGADGTFNPQSSQFTLDYHLLYNDEIVLDCDVIVDVAPTPVRPGSCSNDGERTVQIPTPSDDGTTSVEVVFSMDDQVLETFTVEAMEIGGGGGGQGGPGSQSGRP